MSGDPWSPLSGRPALPGEREAWLERSRIEMEAARQRRQQAHSLSLEEDARKRREKVMAPVKPAASRFTTQAAIDYGRAKGWKLIDREGYDFRLKRHHDTMFATDCLFDDGGVGMVAIQGAGRWEKAAHWQRFVEAGGVETAKRRCVRVLYAEFVRGIPDPVFMEWWS